MEPSPEPHEKSSSRKTSSLYLAVGGALLAVAFVVGISDNPPAILAMLAGFFAVVLGVLHLVGKPGKRTAAQQLLYWSPRALCIAFAVFLSLFALDVFSEGQGFWETLTALFMHLIPTMLILCVLALSWRREWLGGIVFVALGLLYAVEMWPKPHRQLSALLLIAGPLFLTGLLFFLNWHHRAALRHELPKSE